MRAGNASGNILTGVTSGGAGCWAKGAGTTGKVIGTGIKFMDIGGNAVGFGRSGYDMYENGPSISNVAGIAGSGLGLAGNVIQACFTEGTQIVVGAEYDADVIAPATALLRDFSYGMIISGVAVRSSD